MPTPFIYFTNLLFRPSSFLFLSKSSRFHLKSSSSKIENGMEKCLPEEEEKFAKEERGHWSDWIRSGRREVRAHRRIFLYRELRPDCFSSRVGIRGQEYSAQTRTTFSEERDYSPCILQTGDATFERIKPETFLALNRSYLIDRCKKNSFRFQDT